MLILWRLQLVWRQYGEKRQISHSDYWSNRTGSCSAVPLSIQSSYHYENILQIRQVLGHHINAKISPKAASEKAQTMVSENRYTSPKIDVFRTAILTLIAPTGDNAWASFLVHQVLRTSTTVRLYRQMFTQFSLRVWASEYTCRPMIANLLYADQLHHFWKSVIALQKAKNIDSSRIINNYASDHVSFWHAFKTHQHQQRR